MTKHLIAFLLMLPTITLQAQEVFCRYERNGQSHYGKVVKGKIYTLDKAPWAGGKVIAKQGLDSSRVKLLFPTEPKLILGLAKSYQENWENKEPFKNVRWFLKPPSSAASPGDVVHIPSAVDALKVEVELVIVIGKPIKDGDEAESEKAIFGYTLGNDIVGFTDSYYKKEGKKPQEDDALLGSGLKIGDRFAPFGPYIYTGIEWKNRNRRLIIKDKEGKEKVNFENTTSHLLYTPAKIVSDLSKVITLSPGDIIFSGTSKSFVASDGDVVHIAIEGIGEMENKIIATQNNNVK